MGVKISEHLESRPCTHQRSQDSPGHGLEMSSLVAEEAFSLIHQQWNRAIRYEPVSLLSIKIKNFRCCLLERDSAGFD